MTWWGSPGSSPSARKCCKRREPRSASRRPTATASSAADAEEFGRVVAHDEPDLAVAQPLKPPDEVDRLGDSLRVRVVRAEHHAVGANRVDQADYVFFVKGRDVQVLHQDLAGAAEDLAARPEALAAHVAAVVDVVQHRHDPLDTALERHDPQAGAAAEEAASHAGCGR